ncbi:MAG TPA: hypothetical protein VF988_01795, partial [Verrucomicrobiae bacterium]
RERGVITNRRRHDAAEGGSAELHSAVSQICNLQRVNEYGSALNCEGPAECNSAIQQIKNLRYGRMQFYATAFRLTLAVKHHDGFR